jgi:gamma-tubulin complex component 3
MPNFCIDRLHVELQLEEEETYKWAPLSPRAKKTKQTKSKNEETDTEARTGWDVFSLAYDITAPLTAVVHPEAMVQYRRVSSMLFRLKRIEHRLNWSWRASTTLNHALLVAVRHAGGSSAVGEQYAQAMALLRRVSMTRQSVLHFAGNLETYLMFDVLEGGWKDLLQSLSAARTLDDVILAHNRYMYNIVNKSLLLDTEAKTGSISSSSINQNLGGRLARQLELVLGIADRFCSVQDGLFHEVLQSVDRAAQKRRTAEVKTKKGQWGYHHDTDVLGFDTFIELLDEERLEQVAQISREFDTGIRQFLNMLHNQLNDDSMQKRNSQNMDEMYDVPMTPTKHHGNNHRSMSLPTSPRARLSRSRSDMSHNSSTTSIMSSANHIMQPVAGLNYESLRFLTFQLDFSEYYSKQAKSKKSTGTAR